MARPDLLKSIDTFHNEELDLKISSSFTNSCPVWQKLQFFYPLFAGNAENGIEGYCLLLIQEIIQSDLFNGKAADLHNGCFMEEGDLRQGRVFEDKHEQYAQS